MIASVGTIFLRPMLTQQKCCVILSHREKLLLISIFLSNSSLKEWCPGAGLLRVLKIFCSRKAIEKSWTFWLQSGFIHMFLIWTEVLFVQEVSGIYTSLFLDTDELKIALQGWKVPRAFEKCVSGVHHPDPGSSLPLYTKQLLWMIFSATSQRASCWAIQALRLSY